MFVKQGLKTSLKTLFDCKVGVRYGNGPECREETDRVFAEQNVHFPFYLIILLNFIFIFLCIALNFRIVFGWRRSSGSQSPDCCSSCKVRGKRGEGKMVDDRSVVTEE